MTTSPNFWKYSFMSSAVAFQGSPKTIRSPSPSSGEEILVILDSGSLVLGDSSIFLLVVPSARMQIMNLLFVGKWVT